MRGGREGRRLWAEGVASVAGGGVDVRLPPTTALDGQCQQHIRHGAWAGVWQHT
jgi:hypothetical protein